MNKQVSQILRFQATHHTDGLLESKTDLVMCGFAGFIGFKECSGTAVQTSLTSMGDALHHRGPDDYGLWMDADAQVALAHRRLSVIDLSAAGRQPMESASGRFVLVFNGEIYNHLGIRSSLMQGLKSRSQQQRFRGHSDTETLLAALDSWGLERTLAQLNGMFAFALWDRKEQKLVLARDRMGEKPVYYGRSGSVFLFGSELKALAAHPAWQGQIDRDALAAFMRYGYVPAPASIYQGIYKLPTASYLVVSSHELDVEGPICYWNLHSIASRGADNKTSETAFIDELDSLLADSVRLRMEADVPLGAFLSGGYDSSAVVAHMQAQRSSPIRTFSIGFTEAGFDEAMHASLVAKHLGTDHSELYVTPREAMDVIPRLPIIYDEPFADSSQIPTFLVSHLARSQVTVSLSGDGGDELFAGYNRHLLGPRLWSRISLLPTSMRWVAAASLSLALRSGLICSSPRVPLLGEKLEKLHYALVATNGMDVYHRLRTAWPDSQALVLGAQQLAYEVNSDHDLLTNSAMREQMMLMDMQTYLPDDILTKVDRASMAASLEVRVPMLDHRLVEFAWRVPDQFKVRNGQGKWLLRQMLYRYVPPTLLDRPKAGFAVPLSDWLRGPLREWAESLLDVDRLRREGFLDPNLVRQCWSDHLSARRYNHDRIWCILMFQAWLDQSAQTHLS